MLARSALVAALVAALVGAGMAMSGCGGGGAATAAEAERLRVVATTGIAADLMRQVGGDRVEVVSLMPADADPHLFRPGRSDLRTMLEADLVVAHGLGLEGRLADALDRLEASGTPLLRLGELADPADLLADPAAPDAPDPHLWMDPQLWGRLALAVAAELASLDAAGAASHRARGEAHAAELAAIDALAVAAIETVPPASRVLVTAHDAFSYLGRRYGIEVAAVQGISTESEAGLQAIESIVALVSSRQVPAIFIERTVSPRPIEAVVAGVAAAGGEVAVGGTLYSDALGAEGSGADTVAGMLQHNLRTIVEGLGGRWPAPPEAETR
jgi:manganese/zinc/iron transport system substrate-binding protein